MAPEHSSEDADRPQGDPWHAFGYLVSGVGFYGLIGFGLDRWLGTRFLVVVGIFAGAVLGLYLTWTRFRPPPEQPPPDTHDRHDD
jgi:hypothetical protein